MNPDWHAETKPCLHCGAPFGPLAQDGPALWARRRYCSPPCGHRRPPRPRVPYLTCGQCGVRFWSEDRGQRFCGRACARQSRLADLARQGAQMRASYGPEDVASNVAGRRDGQQGKSRGLKAPGRG